MQIRICLLVEPDSLDNVVTVVFKLQVKSYRKVNERKSEVV